MLSSVFSDHLDCASPPPHLLQSLWVWVTLALCQSSTDEDVPGPASAPLMDICSDLLDSAGPQAGLQNPLELVSNLPPCLDLWQYPHPHADSEDGRPLQARLWPQGGWAELEEQAVVPNSPAAKAGLLSDSVLPHGGAHKSVDQCGLHPSVGAAGWSTDRAGLQRLPL